MKTEQEEKEALKRSQAFLDRTIKSKDKFNALLKKREQLLMSRASIEELMDVDAELGKDKLENYTGKEIDFNPEGIRTANRFIQENRNILIKQGKEVKHSIIIAFEAFLGKYLVQELGGKWEFIGHYLGGPTGSPMGSVSFDDKFITHPAIRVQSFIDKGSYCNLFNYIKGVKELKDTGHLTSGYLINQDEIWIGGKKTNSKK